MRPALWICALAASVAATMSAAAAKTCYDDSIQEVSESGEIIVMLSGQIFEVDPGDRVDSALWLAAEDVLICETPVNYQGKVYMLYEIINTDESAEKVSAHRLK